MKLISEKIDRYAPKVLGYLINILEKARLSFDKSEKNKYGYEDLTPVDNADEDGKYCELLGWALSNKKIKNIAVTGTYGSGKSSILRTYEKTNLQYKYLFISLASFKEDADDCGAEIEKNILLQTFYKVENSKIPYSRFRKIGDLKVKNFLKGVMLCCTVVASGAILFVPSIIDNAKDNLNLLEKAGIGKSVIGVVSILFLVSFMIALLKMIKFIKGININKIKIDKTELERNNENASSIFNKHMDEIIYFFDVIKYDVVIFEDLDRFKNSIDVFTKLREINAILNNSEQIGRRIVFIYALKDNIFQDNEKRTKFFDFIIPVIPVINSSNSCEVFREKLLEKGIDLPESFISDITIYVNDMRTLINICNEFILYKEKLGGIKFDLKNLFGMIVYKNIEPRDFAALQNNNGVVFDILNSKEKLLFANVEQIDGQIKQIKEKLELINKEHLENVEELQIVYFEELRRRSPGYCTHNGQFVQYDNNKTVLFQRALKRTDKFQLSNNSHYDFFTVDNKKQNYLDRYDGLVHGKKTSQDDLNEQLYTLKKKKDIAKKMPLKDLLTKDNLKELFPEEINNRKLLIFLMRNGYINEMYQDYITYFYPGSLTREDMEFLGCIKNYEALPFDHKLSRCEQIVNRMNVEEFKQEEVLNYDLVEYLLARKEEYEVLVERLISQLANETEKSVSFIDGYIGSGRNERNFIFVLCKEWNNLWRFIENKSTYPQSKKDEYLSLIIKFADIDDIIKINNEGMLCKYISQKEDFLTIVNEEQYIEKVKMILEKLSVRFENLIPPYSNEEKTLFEFVYTKNLYEINEEMIRLIIDLKLTMGSDKKEQFENRNYTFLKESKCDCLMEYIDDNILKYVQTVFLKLEHNKNENEEGLLELLNREEIDEQTKVAVIMKESVVVSDIEDVKEHSLWEVLIKESKVGICWDNLIKYYAKNEEIDDSIISFINKNYIELSALFLNAGGILEGSIYNNIAKKIVGCEGISDEAFDEIRKSLPWYYSSFEEGLSEKRIDSIIDGRVVRLSKNSIAFLKRKYKDKHITLIEKNIDSIIEKYAECELDSNDIKKLLESGKIGELQKKDVIKSMNKLFIVENKEVAILTWRIIIKPEFGELDQELLKAMIESRFLSTENKIELICKAINYFSKEVIMAILEKLSSPYSDITVFGSRPTLEDTKINREFVKLLNDKDYISSYSSEKNRLRVNTYKGERE